MADDGLIMEGRKEPKEEKGYFELEGRVRFSVVGY